MPHRIHSVDQLARPLTLLEEAEPAPIITMALIAAYNEQRFIGSVVLAARQHVDLVVVVDDGSQDGTGEIAQQAGAVVVRHATNAGKAAAISSGLRYARQLRPAVVVMLDGDGQHAADDIPAVIAPVLGDAADLVVGSRFLDVASAIPAYRQVGQHSLTLITNVASGVALSDSQSGFRALSARAIETLSFSESGFSVESEMQFRAKEEALRVAEVPIKVFYREPAKRNPVTHGLEVLNGILRMVGQTRPLVYFGLASASALILGTTLGLAVIDTYHATARLALGYALITVLLCVVGMLLFFAGVLLHSMRTMLLDMRRNMLHSLGDS